MNTACRVRLHPTGKWLRGVLTDEIEPRLGPCVIVKGRARWAHQVDAVCVFSGCPMELFDQAVEAGFFVLGKPRTVV